MRHRIHLCDACKTRLLRNDLLDAWWCPRCDEWAEDTCGDPACAACAARPPRPSMVALRDVASERMTG